MSLRAEITEALNRHSAENPSNTPDWILAEYLLDCLVAWDKAVSKRTQWYGGEGGCPMSDHIAPTVGETPGDQD